MIVMHIGAAMLPRCNAVFYIVLMSHPLAYLHYCTLQAMNTVVNDASERVGTGRQVCELLVHIYVFAFVFGYCEAEADSGRSDLIRQLRSAIQHEGSSMSESEDCIITRVIPSSRAALPELALLPLESVRPV